MSLVLYSVAVRALVLVSLVCASLVTSETELLFTYLFATCMSSLLTYLFQSFDHFQIGSFKHEFWLFTHPGHKPFAIDQNCDCLFPIGIVLRSLMASFDEQKVFIKA